LTFTNDLNALISSSAIDTINRDKIACTAQVKDAAPIRGGDPAAAGLNRLDGSAGLLSCPTLHYMGGLQLFRSGLLHRLLGVRQWCFNQIVVTKF
jgi:hypothetical protein